MDRTFENLFLLLEALNVKVETVIASKRNPDGLDKDEFVQAEKAAEYLGVKLSTLYSYTRARKLRHYKRGTTLYFSKTELNEYIRAGVVEPQKLSRK